MCQGRIQFQFFLPPFTLSLSSFPPNELETEILSSFSSFYAQMARSCYVYFNPSWEKLAKDLIPMQKKKIISAHLSRVAVLFQDQQAEHELCINRFNDLTQRVWPLEEEYDTHQANLDVTKGEKLKYKAMCQSIEDYAKARATIFADIWRLPLELMQTRLDNIAYYERNDYEIATLKQLI